MAIRNPNENEVISEYDELQSEAINTNNDTIVTEIGAIKQSILTILSKLNLISDWEIESGSNPNGNWEKWESGKFVQRGFYNSVTPINIVIGAGYRAAEAINFNAPFLTGTVPHVMTSSTNYATVNVQSTTATTVQVGYTSFDINRQPGRVHYVATGRWK